MDTLQTVNFIFFVLNNKVDELNSPLRYQLLSPIFMAKGLLINGEFFIDLKEILDMYIPNKLAKHNQGLPLKNIKLSKPLKDKIVDTIYWLEKGKYLGVQSAQKMRHIQLYTNLDLRKELVPLKYGGCYFHGLKEHTSTYDFINNTVTVLPNNYIIAGGTNKKLALFDSMLNYEEFEIGPIQNVLLLNNNIVLLNTNKLIVWNYETKKIEKEIEIDDIMDMQFLSPNKFVIISLDNVLRIWENYTCKEIPDMNVNRLLVLDYIIAWKSNEKTWIVYTHIRKDMSVEFSIIDIVKLSNIKYIVIT